MSHMLIHLQGSCGVSPCALMATISNSLLSLISILKPIELVIANNVYWADLGHNGPMAILNSFKYSFTFVASIFGVKGYFLGFVLYWARKIQILISYK